MSGSETKCWLRPSCCEPPRRRPALRRRRCDRRYQGSPGARESRRRLVYDAVRVRLIEIGEAVKGISAERLEAEPEIPWQAIARMRDHLAHHYFDTDHAIVKDVVDNEIEPLLEAVRSLQQEGEQSPEAS